jgi:PleD family two-component response regulator
MANTLSCLIDIKMSADSSSIYNNVHFNKQKRILIVDDEPDIISAFEMILKMSGFEVEAYNDPYWHYPISSQIRMAWYY